MVAAELERKGCVVTGIDESESAEPRGVHRYYAHDLSTNRLPISLQGFSHVLILDVVEHVSDAEAFVTDLHERCGTHHDLEFIVTTGNVAFLVVRLMLLVGAFNYGTRGILDRTHKRLFTFRSIRQLFEERGFRVLEEQGIAAPFPLALGDTRLARALLKVNGWLIRVSRGLFSFQILLRLKPLPSVVHLLEQTIRSSDERKKKGYQPMRRYPDSRVVGMLQPTGSRLENLTKIPLEWKHSTKDDQKRLQTTLRP